MEERRCVPAGEEFSEQVQEICEDLCLGVRAKEESLGSSFEKLQSVWVFCAEFISGATSEFKSGLPSPPQESLSENSSSNAYKFPPDQTRALIRTGSRFD
ncbi:hypothetical protein KSP40_PGU010876 [Platanthera guangdongensis]|uniref:Uncharacterized protein n=1 Tax=Platanthera guangdongensis TaxID=2320717 RepID=A0ABR2N2Y4_9ASPA